MRANFSLHYCDKPFIIKLDHFSSYVVKSICLKKDQFSIVQSDIKRNMLDKIFCVITNRVNRDALKFNWVCSRGLIRINAVRIPIHKTTYFKDVTITITI